MDSQEVKAALHSRRILRWKAVSLVVVILLLLIGTMRADQMAIFNLGCLIAAFITLGLTMDAVRLMTEAVQGERPYESSLRWTLSSRRVGWVVLVVAPAFIIMHMLFFWPSHPCVVVPRDNPKQAFVASSGRYYVPVSKYSVIHFQDFAFERAVKDYPAMVINCKIGDSTMALYRLFGSQEKLEQEVKWKVDSAFAHLDSTYMYLTQHLDMYEVRDRARYYQYLADANRLVGSMSNSLLPYCRLDARNLEVW